MTKGIHRHKFNTNTGRTVRTCEDCGCHQHKVSGKWVAVACAGCAPDEACAAHSLDFLRALDPDFSTTVERPGALNATEVLASLGWRQEGGAEPACPGCGMTAQVEPSRTAPGLWMCHGCAKTFSRSPA